MSPNAFVTRSSVKKLVIDRKLGDSPFGKGKGGASPSTGNGENGARARVTFDPESEASSRGNLFGSSTNGRSGAQEDDSHDVSNGTPVKRSGGTSANLTEKETGSRDVSSSEWPARPAKSTPAPQQGDYYTTPSIDSLKKMPASQLRQVRDLVVGRVGYGQVAFLEPVDLTTLSSVEDLLGGVVVFEERNVAVYPDDAASGDKPRAGSGLNVPANITLEKCWPVDKATRQPIKEGPRLEKHIKRLRSLPDTSFISYEDGNWHFSVEGF